MRTQSIKTKIENYFYLYPTRKLRVREIERVVKVPLPSAIRYANELHGEKMLQEIKISNIKLFAPDRTSKQFIRGKQLFNLKQIYASGLIEHLKEKYFNPTIILFGSYSRGEDIEDSDIDLYIETPSKIELSELEQFSRKLKRPIQVFSHKSLAPIKSPELKNNIINGIKLNGQLEVFK
jgi:predicted nucleotidyltransferase